MEFNKQSTNGLIKQGLAPSTIDVYKRSMLRLRREKPGRGQELPPGGVYKLSLPLLKDVEGNLQVIRTWALGSQRSALSALVNLSKITNTTNSSDMVRRYNEELSRVRAAETLEAMDNNANNVDNIKPYNQYVDVDKVMKNPSNDKRTEKVNDFRKVLLSIYKNLPPLRTSEVSDMSYSSDDPNYVDMQNNNIVIRDHKSSKLMGNRTIHMNQELIDVIKAHHDKYPSDVYLFQDYEEPRPMSYVRMSQIITKLMGATPSQLRKSYISTYVPKMTKEQRIKTANAMGHTINTQELSYKTSIEQPEYNIYTNP